VAGLQTEVNAKDAECASLKIAIAELRDEHEASIRDLQANHEA
jgi:hypothetical protein